LVTWQCAWNKYLCSLVVAPQGTELFFEEKIMKKIMSGVLATVLSVSFVGAEMLPASAASIYVPQEQSASSDIVLVAGRGDRGGDQSQIYRRHYNGSRYYNDRHNRRSGHYWRGHRGYDHYRHGYRRHGDFWFPLAAFATGAIISGAIANDAPPAYSGNSHVQYCYNRYKSYRASDNTFQPYNGPRQQCRSPY
jgi:hypothetical protein